MAKRKNLKRKYPMSDGDLIELSNEIEYAAKRDLIALTAFGINQAKLDEIAGLREAFTNHPIDAYYSGQIMEKSEAKNSALSNLYLQAKGIAHRVINRWGEISPQYRRLRFSGYVQQTESDQYLLAIYLHRVATGYLPELISEGLTQAHLDTFEAQAATVLESIIAQWEAISNRDFGVHERLVTGNSLFDKISAVAKTGMTVWSRQNESLYNDYVRYTRQTAPGLQTVEGTVEPLSLAHPAVDIQRKNERIEFTNTGTVPLFVYITDDISGAPNEWAILIAPAQHRVLKASEIGYAAKRKYLLVRNDHPTEKGQFIIKN